MSTLWVVGDSTLSEFNDNYYYPRYGYGTKLHCYLDDKVVVNNIALSGRSSVSFTTEPEYKKLVDGIAAGDFLIMGFGHNDEKTEAGRFSSPVGNYMENGTFAHSLYENYISLAKKAGATPIICTPIVRRSADGNWKDAELHVTSDFGEFEGGDYAEAARRLAVDTKTYLVDMTAKTKMLYDELGADNTIFLHAWPSNKELSVDNTHTNVWGAMVNAHMVMSAIKSLGINGLSEHIINIDADNPYPEKEKYLKFNEAYVPTVFSSVIMDSKLFTEAFGFKGTVFGDLACIEGCEDDFVLEEKNNGIHMAVKNNNGKISAVTDGIAMYYKQVSTSKNFSLKAKITVNDFFYNDQVSFGLMVRDDIYTDTKTPDPLGDFVAAAPLYLTHDKETWSCFARKSGILTKGGYINSKIETGKEMTVELSSTQDGYTASFYDGPVITGGFDFKLTAIDPEHVYVGFFVSRNADVTFTDIEYTEI